MVTQEGVLSNGIYHPQRKRRQNHFLRYVIIAEANPISVKDKNSFDKATAEEMKERAVKNGLLTRAQENAAMLIKDLINKSVPGAKSFTIEFVVATPEE